MGFFRLSKDGFRCISLWIIRSCRDMFVFLSNCFICAYLLFSVTRAHKQYPDPHPLFLQHLSVEYTGNLAKTRSDKDAIFNLWIANNSRMQAVKSPPWIIVFCVCRDVNKPLHPGLTCVLFVFQVDDVFTIAFTCAVCSSLFPTVFLCNWRTGFWQQISLDGINKLEFRCFFCVTPGLLPGVLLCYWSL